MGDNSTIRTVPGRARVAEHSAGLLADWPRRIGRRIDQHSWRRVMTTVPVALAVAIAIAVAFASIPRDRAAPSSLGPTLQPASPPLTIEHLDFFGAVSTRLVKRQDSSSHDTPADRHSTVHNPASEIRVHRGDTLLALLTRAGISGTEAFGLVRNYSEVRELRLLTPGQVLQLAPFPSGRIRELRYPLSDEEVLRFWRDDDDPGGKLNFARIRIVPEIQIAYASGTIESALFTDGQQAGLSDTVIIQLAEIFGWDIDFSHDLRVGDRFAVAYQERFSDGRRLDDGAVLAAEFVNQGRRYRAVGYPGESGTISYYTPEGLSLRRPFLRSPLKYTRITSGFTHKRFHPILKNWGAHTGIDYGAPAGTPVHATADGRVQFAGANGGYGNMVILRHGGSYSTVYAHLSRFAPAARTGSDIAQGNIIGYVGATGLATGPHLHYEFRVDGTHKNPLTFRFPLADPVPPEQREAFLGQAARWSSTLDVLGGHTVAQR